MYSSVWEQVTIAKVQFCVVNFTFGFSQ